MLQREAADEILVSQRRKHRPGSLVGHWANIRRPGSSIVEAHHEAVVSEICGFLNLEQHSPFTYLSFNFALSTFEFAQPWIGESRERGKVTQADVVLGGGGVPLGGRKALPSR